MGPVDRVSGADIAVDFLIVGSQCLIAYYFLADARNRLSKPIFRTILTGLGLIWLATLAGLLLNLIRPTGVSHTAAVLGSWASAIEIMWGVVSVVSVVAYSIARCLIRNSVPHSRSRRGLIMAGAGAVMTAPVAALAFGGIIERTSFRVVETDLPIPNLHPDLEGFTISQISDLHVSPYLSVRQAARAIDMANELKPRLALMTGDLISSSGDPLDATITEVARLRADLGVLGCLGNHEIYADCEDYTEQQARRRGVEFLRLTSRRIRWGSGELNIAGVDYQPFRMRASYLRGADKLVVTGVPNILLSHNPDVFPVAVRQGYQAVIGGHTHAGQVTVEILRQTLNVVRVATPYVAGLYRKDGASCYVTAGIGTIGMPVRLGAPPEITLLKLRRA